MLSAKQQMLKVLQAQPENRTMEELLRELAFVIMVERGRVDTTHFQHLTDDQQQRKLKSIYLGMLLLDEETLEDLLTTQEVKQMLHAFLAGDYRNFQQVSSFAGLEASAGRKDGTSKCS
jgi:hypothetical protein